MFLRHLPTRPSENSLSDLLCHPWHAPGLLTYFLTQGPLIQQGRQGLEEHVHFTDQENKVHRGACAQEHVAS